MVLPRVELRGKKMARSSITQTLPKRPGGPCVPVRLGETDGQIFLDLLETAAGFCTPRPSAKEIWQAKFPLFQRRWRKDLGRLASACHGRTGRLGPGDVAGPGETRS